MPAQPGYSMTLIFGSVHLPDANIGSRRTAESLFLEICVIATRSVAINADIPGREVYLHWFKDATTTRPRAIILCILGA